MLFTKVSILAVAGLVAANNANINERYVSSFTSPFNHMLTCIPAMPTPSTSARPSP